MGAWAGDDIGIMAADEVRIQRSRVRSRVTRVMEQHQPSKGIAPGDVRCSCGQTFGWLTTWGAHIAWVALEQS